MKKVALFSLLLIAGLVLSQFLGEAGAAPIRLLTMAALSFIMIHVGLEFEIDKTRPRQYVWDYVVAGTAASFPWIFCCLYFVFVMAPSALWGHIDLWRETLLESLFASPTSAGVLFSMLAAAGLGATWVFKKARILAIFDDLNTIILLIPLKMMMVGNKWQLWVMVVIIFGLLWLAWKYLCVLKLPASWPWIMAYSVLIVGISEAIYLVSKRFDPNVPIHLEVLLPAFALGCMMKVDHHQMEQPAEKRINTLVSAAFMVLVGLSMPAINAPKAPTSDDSNQRMGLAHDAMATTETHHHAALSFSGVSEQVLAKKNDFPGWGMIAVHVLLVTFISNLGKLFPAFCYRKEAKFKERLALAIGMFPRGEVGAGVLVISLGYGLGGPALTVAVLSLALNLLLTGVFIMVVKRLLAELPKKESLA